MQPSLAKAQQMLARAFAAHKAGNVAQAVVLYRRVLEVDKQQADALHMLGLIEGQRGNFAAGMRLLNEALRIRPNAANTWIDLGWIHGERGDTAEAIACYRKALAIEPRSALAHNNLANALLRLHQGAQALTHCEAALAIAGDYVDAWQTRGNVLFELNRSLDALASYDRALAIKPDFPPAWYGRGMATSRLGRREEAYAAYAKVFALRPDRAYLEGERLFAKVSICQWDNLENECAHLAAAIRQRAPRATPFCMVVVSPSLADQKACAELYVADRCPASAQPLWRGERYQHDRIRIAYLSADFHGHATAYLAAGLFELHDRSRFETTAVSFGPDASDDMRSRLRVAFDRFLELRSRSDREIAATLRELEIDIAVDLKGFTMYSRPAIFAQRAAPLQVSYLGYPGTMAASYFDYIVADQTVIPPEHAAFYAEKIAWLPDSYQVNDSGRRIAERTPTRSELNLPDEGFVYCCFNNSCKIQPAVFDVWMRLLAATAGSVLWLFEENAAVARNLRIEAARRGIAPERLVFAPRLPHAEHLARHRQADLMLDTLPCNAHTTASDALWAGVPIVACLGSTFAGRVAGSLLRAVGLPELVTASLPDYEALALRIAHEPALAAALKERLARNREVAALFDTRRFTRNIEAAYTAMWQRSQRGEPPQSFVVAPA
jgi:predicted O-linked N-acetylglucosamine transferase (SPINDLY family)